MDLVLPSVLRGALIIPDPSYRIPIYLMIALVLTAGTAFLMWLGEQITEKGIGNGISFHHFRRYCCRLYRMALNIWLVS
jgi:preprotein translocase subunit SecY